MNGIMMRRRHFLTLSAVALAGCAGRHSPGWHTYTDSVSSILMSEDARKLVVAGQDYHYIFDTQPLLVETMQAEFKSYVTARIEGFAVTDQEQTAGGIELVLSLDAPRWAIQQAVEAGYENSFTQEGYRYTGRLTLMGTRYAAVGINSTLVRQDSLETYPVLVVVDEPAPERSAAARVLTTPIVALGNGALALAAIPLAILFVPVQGLVLLTCHDSAKGCSFGGGH